MHVNYYSSSPSIVLRYLFGIAVMNDTIYACGGMSVHDGVFQNTCEQFTLDSGDTGDGTWYFVSATLPVAVGYLAMAAVEGKVYAIGGYDGFC